MNKIFSFLKKSNRYKHLIGGLLVGLCALSTWPAIYSAIVAASCLELKDKPRHVAERCAAVGLCHTAEGL